jgi:hypothetical protein
VSGLGLTLRHETSRGAGLGFGTVGNAGRLITRTSLAGYRSEMLLLLTDNANRRAARQSKFQVSKLETRRAANGARSAIAFCCFGCVGIAGALLAECTRPAVADRPPAIFTCPLYVIARLGSWPTF